MIELWFVIDRDADDRKVRGPFDTSADAGRSRSELELHHPHYKDHGNLWVVSELHE